jgi:hypothetical protein
MAVVTRRYRWVSTTNPNAQRFVAPSAAVLVQYVNSVDVQVDNAVGGTTETLDEYMNTLGYVFDPTAPAGPSGLVGIGRWGMWINFGSGASQPMTLVSSSYSELIMPRAGYLLAMSSYTASNIPAGGACVFQPRKTSVPTTALGPGQNIVGADWAMNSGAFPRNRIMTYAPGAFPFAGGDKLGINLSTNPLAGGNTYSVQIEVVYT